MSYCAPSHGRTLGSRQRGCGSRPPRRATPGARAAAPGARSAWGRPADRGRRAGGSGPAWRGGDSPASARLCPSAGPTRQDGSPGGTRLGALCGRAASCPAPLARRPDGRTPRPAGATAATRRQAARRTAPSRQRTPPAPGRYSGAYYVADRAPGSPRRRPRPHTAHQSSRAGARGVTAERAGSGPARCPDPMARPPGVRHAAPSAACGLGRRGAVPSRQRHAPWPPHGLGRPRPGPDRAVYEDTRSRPR
jgi:hypothetical protein